MTDAPTPDPPPPPTSPRPRATGPGADIPVTVRRLSDERDAAPDYIAPLSALAAIVGVLGTTCVPLATVASMFAAGGPPGTSTTAPSGAAPVGGPTTWTLVGALVFFVIALLGIFGGIGGVLRREWGRKLLLAYAGLVLLYLITAVYFRMRFGIEGTTRTAPTGSALALNLTCVFGVLIAVAALMVVILRYFTLPHIKRRFR